MHLRTRKRRILPPQRKTLTVVPPFWDRTRGRHTYFDNSPRSVLSVPLVPRDLVDRQWSETEALAEERRYRDLARAGGEKVSVFMTGTLGNLDADSYAAHFRIGRDGPLAISHAVSFLERLTGESGLFLFKYATPVKLEPFADGGKCERGPFAHSLNYWEVDEEGYTHRLDTADFFSHTGLALPSRMAKYSGPERNVWEEIIL